MTQRGGAINQTIVIEPRKSISLFDISEYVRYRSMIKRLVLRDIKSKFEDMKLSVLWNLVRPLSVTTVFVLFKRASGATTGEVMPYPLFIYSGLIMWFYFTDSAQEAASSLRKDAGIISKVYFPRLIIPIVPVISNLILLGISLMPLLCMMAYFSSGVGFALLLLPAIVIQCVVLALGVGILFASLSLRSRDFEQLLSFLLYIGLFVSGVYFSPALFKGPIAALIYINPMAATMQSFRASLETSVAFPWVWWLYALMSSIVILLIGVHAFNSVEKELVDRL